MNVYYFRHGPANYGPILDVLATRPDSGIDYSCQSFPDATQEGLVLAKEVASSFFSKFDPTQCEFEFWSSAEARALDYAYLFFQNALDRFDVVCTVDMHPVLVREPWYGNIRVLSALSLNYHSALWQGATFFPAKQTPAINWDVVDSSVRKRWEAARVHVLGEDHGTWCKNYFYHSKMVLRYYQDLLTPYDLHKRQFKDLVHLIRVAAASESESRLRKENKERVIVAFGHDNYPSHCLNNLFNEFELGHLEKITFRVDNDLSVRLTMRGVEKEIIFT